MKKLTIISFILISILFYTDVIEGFIEEAIAQIDATGVAITTPVEDPNAADGHVLCLYPDGLRRCEAEYETSMYGVITDNPSASVKDDDIVDGRLVVTSGMVSVRSSTVNGNIETGDFVTTSEVPGVVQKASRNGYVLGKSYDGFSSDDPNTEGRIQVLIAIHPEAGLTGPGSNLLQFIREGISVPLFEPLASLRYLLAVLMVLISFTLGMVYFGRSSRAGIEAIGRNPLAKKVIQLTVIINIVLTIVIVLVGLAVAYLILVL